MSAAIRMGYASFGDFLPVNGRFLVTLSIFSAFSLPVPASSNEIVERCGLSASGFVSTRNGLVCIRYKAAPSEIYGGGSLPPGISVGSGVNHYGPRGGCYRLTSSGKKDYGAC